MAKTNVTYAYAADIVKSERDENGDLLVYGKATGPDLDLDAQICDPTWLKSAMPAWMEWGNVREMHGPIAAGVGMELTEVGGDWMLLSKCVDKSTAEKIEAKVLKGYSIGISDAGVIKDAVARNGRINRGAIVEISYVDRPCNPTAKLAIAKAAGLSDDGTTAEVEDGATLPLEPVEISEPAVLIVDDAPSIDDLAKSWRAVPSTLGKAVAADLKRRVTKLVGAEALAVKASPDADVASAQAAIMAIAQLIQSEAESLAAGQMCDADQIGTLLRAIDALTWFQCMERMEAEMGEPDVTVAIVELDATAETSKIADKTSEVETETRPSVDDLVKAAVTKAMEAHEAELSTLRAELVKVNARPIPGGPVLARSGASIAKAEERGSALAEAERFERKALELDGSDAVAAAGFRELAVKMRTRVATP